MPSTGRLAPGPQQDVGAWGDGSAPRAPAESTGWSPGPEQRAPRWLPVRCQIPAPAPAAPCPWGAHGPVPIPEPRLLEAARATAKQPITVLINTRLNIKIDSPAGLTFQQPAVPSSPPFLQPCRYYLYLATWHANGGGPAPSHPSSQLGGCAALPRPQPLRRGQLPGRGDGFPV